MSDRTPLPPELRYERITRALLDQPWAILPSKLQAIAEFIALKARGGTLTEAEIAALTASAPPSQFRQEGAIAVLPVFGVLCQRLNLMSAMSGGTSTELLSKEFARLVADPSISAIVLDVDSPGGSVSGIPEFAAQIARARSVKPIVAVADSMAASAAYWISSAAHQISATPSALVGSIGAVILHEEFSRANEMAGVTLTPIFAGQYKVEGNDFQPLGDEAKGAMQKIVDDAYALFTGDVARFRNASISDVRGAAFGEGRVFGAREAVQRGMADRVETLGDVLARLSTAQGRSAVMRTAGLQQVHGGEVIVQIHAPAAGEDAIGRDAIERALSAAVANGRLVTSSTYPTPSEFADADHGAPDIDMQELAAAFAAHMEA